MLTLHSTAYIDEDIEVAAHMYCIETVIQASYM